MGSDGYREQTHTVVLERWVPMVTCGGAMPVTLCPLGGLGCPEVLEYSLDLRTPVCLSAFWDLSHERHLGSLCTHEVECVLGLHFPRGRHQEGECGLSMAPAIFVNQLW